MSNQTHQTPVEEKNPVQKQNNSGEAVEISLPNTERPEGPFEHSGETARQTTAEEAEKKDQES